jgi:4-amino-4-deoxy-L-arabinose transferase-like glycosyltransferase
MGRKNFLYLSLLVILWLITVFIVNPIGNFPLNDDWQYARPVQYLINSGHYASTDAYSPIIVAQVYWGALFCLPGGFSFNALRCSTEVLSLTSAVVFYFLLLKSSKNSELSFLATMLLIANPLYVVSSGSFMTDVPFLTFTLLAIYFFYYYMESDKPIHIIVGTFFAVVAVLIRQFGVVIPIAFGITCIIKNKPKFPGIIKYLLPAIVTAIALKAGLFWLKHIGAELQPYGGSTLHEFLSNPNNIYQRLLKVGSFILVYSGFFLLPVLVFTTRYVLVYMTKWQKAIMIFIVLLFIPLLIIWCQKLPAGNVLSTYGIGPPTLKSAGYLALVNPDFPPLVLIILQMLGGIGAVLLLINITRRIINVMQAHKLKEFENASFMAVFMLLLCVGYAILLFIPDFFFDRYLLPFIPLSAIIVFTGMNGYVKVRLPIYITCCSITVGIALFSSAVTHDYFAWNRLRWQATDYLTKDLKVSPHKIDGGYEYNGWMIGKYYPEAKGKSWWFVDDDEYVVAFHNLDGYTIMKQYSYQSYLPYEIKNIYILHRK